MEMSNHQLKKGADKKGSEAQTTKLKKSSIDQDEDDSALFTEILKIIENMYEMRFIQKIARPIQKRVKQQYVQKFAGKMEGLHNKIQRVRNEIIERSNNQAKNNAKNKSIVGSVTSKPLDWKKSIRLIEARYTQVFIDGSFKYYPKFVNYNGFTYPMKVMKIDEWATSCLNYNKNQKKLCDCF